MQITIVQGAFLPVPPVAGGAVEKLWFELGSEFAKRGLSVTHLSRAWPGLPAQGAIEGVSHRRLRGFNYPKSRVVAKLMDLIYSLRCLFAVQRSDVIVTNTFFLPLLLSLLPRRGAVYVSMHRYPQGQMSLYRKADRVQCVSTAVADAVKEQAPSIGPLVKVVPNYVSSLIDEAQWAAGWAQRESEILYVGRVHPEKGLDLLIDAYAAVPADERRGWRLRVVGPHETQAGGGGTGYIAELRQRAASRGIAVDWAGPLYDKAALNACYARAGLFVYPSVAARGEAFGLAPLEAMAQGCPVITSDLACFRDFVDPGRNGEMFTLGGNTVDGLRATLQRLLNDPALRRRHAQAAFATVRNFSLARVADAFVDDFRELSRA